MAPDYAPNTHTQTQSTLLIIYTIYTIYPINSPYQFLSGNTHRYYYNQYNHQINFYPIIKIHKKLLFCFLFFKYFYSVFNPNN